MTFCAEIADRPEIVFFRNNRDNTTSIFYVKNNIHIMTFNNENKVSGTTCKNRCAPLSS